jgi:N-acyl-D-amino-acid deacylase
MSALKRSRPPQDAAGADELMPRIETAVTKGRDWLLANKPVSTEDRVFHLRGLVDSGAEAKAIEAARQRLLEDQWADGSWAQLDRMSGDAYATATVLTALRHAGLDAKHDAYVRGVEYLLEAQQEDGAWIVQTRSKPLQLFFDNGDPGGKSQFISFAATGWAVLALLETVPHANREK